jgi:hypothetical protein
MNMRNLLAASLFCGIVLTLSAQQSVAPPPKPANDAPANAEVLKLLRAAMPESVVLDKIRAITEKFDTSSDALVTLKQSGATEAELKAILARDSVPAQPAEQPHAAAPADNGPSLAETMQFLQDKLNEFGKVSFVAYFQNTNDGNQWTTQDTLLTSNVVADPGQCRISYHRKFIENGKTFADVNNVYSLREVQEIMVKPLEQLENELNAQNGNNLVNTSNSPPVMKLVVRRPHGEQNTFIFTDADLADRVARAMQHAVELCGGGNKDKF